MKNRDLAFLPASLFSRPALAAGYIGRAVPEPTIPSHHPATDDNVFPLHSVGGQPPGHTETDARIRDYYLYLPSTLTPQHCTRARALLSWSREALAFRSGASINAIEQFESSSRPLNDVTRQALAYALEAQGLLFFAGHEPVWSNGCPGPTLDPRQRIDFHAIE
jgi:hypothetical protein